MLTLQETWPTTNRPSARGWWKIRKTAGNAIILSEISYQKPAKNNFFEKYSISLSSSTQFCQQIRLNFPKSQMLYLSYSESKQLSGFLHCIDDLLVIEHVDGEQRQTRVHCHVVRNLNLHVFNLKFSNFSYINVNDFHSIFPIFEPFLTFS